MNANLEKSLAIASVSTNQFGRKVFVMFFVEKQSAHELIVQPVWDMEFDTGGQIAAELNTVRKLKVEDIWSFVTSLNKWQEMWLRSLDLDYHFHQDEKALERLAEKMEMDKLNIGYEGESEDGTWFTCLRLDDYRHILPDNLHIYSLRASDDDDSQPASIEARVMVNHYGDILTGKALPVPMELKVESVGYDDEGNIIG